MKGTPAAGAQKTTWSVQVVRGVDPGRAFELGAGETVLGNALDGVPGVDLRDQEGNSPRRMAGRHAALVATVQELSIRDLASPGGTFVNSQRLLSGQTRRLAPGDLIQLGSVQLQVKRNGPASVSASAAAATGQPAAPAPANAVAPARPAVSAAPRDPPGSAKAAAAPGPTTGRLSIPFTMPGGVVCKSWDDFLVLAAGQWAELRAELASGRVADYLRKIQRPDLVPRFEPGRSADEQLDDWLGRLPVTRPSAAELDVYPEALNVRALPGGGLTHQSLRVTNVGYRLLRTTARIEPVGTSWLRLRPEHDGRSFMTIDHAELPLELHIPEIVDRPLAARVVLESNGGTKRVVVQVERPAAPQPIPEPTAVVGSEIQRLGAPLGERLARVPPVKRVVTAAAAALGLRLVIAALSLLPLGAALSRPLEPRLAAVTLVLAGAGALAGAALALARSDREDVPFAAFAGGAFGLLGAAICHAAIQSVEHVLGPWSSSIWTVGLFWAAIGALAGLGSTFLVPHRADEVEVAR
jgi:hypothetical protein